MPDRADGDRVSGLAGTVGDPEQQPSDRAGDGDRDRDGVGAEEEAAMGDDRALGNANAEVPAGRGAAGRGAPGRGAAGRGAAGRVREVGGVVAAGGLPPASIVTDGARRIDAPVWPADGRGTAESASSRAATGARAGSSPASVAC
ncbi:hypothetical protein GCM10012284_08500 [Mangrovihabitans endophyticus]|uniref:Uncharacterized protein n=1 Tax=Mangrovihabitans endophyticus TaxID=1751298 RepID=A0A8J3FMX9_9ACTN|nr:hypothetical protein GCM10012284_08500 [Mangrovihabitans endophyticus]